MKNLIHTVIIAGLTLGAATISQASVFTTSETAPIAGSVLISNDTASTKNMTARVNGVKDDGSSLSDRTLGQSFTSSVAGSINAISVKLGGGFNNNPANTNNFSALVAGKGNLLLNVFDMTGPGISLTQSPVVYDMAGQDLSGLNYSYVTFELGETLTIDANIEYGFEFGWDPAYIADLEGIRFIVTLVWYELWATMHTVLVNRSGKMLTPHFQMSAFEFWKQRQRPRFLCAHCLLCPRAKHLCIARWFASTVECDGSPPSLGD